MFQFSRGDHRGEINQQSQPRRFPGADRCLPEGLREGRGQRGHAGVVRRRGEEDVGPSVQSSQADAASPGKSQSKLETSSRRGTSCIPTPPSPTNYS